MTSTSRLKQLIAVAKEGSSNKRRDLLREITDVFMATPDRYSSSEMQHFDVIMSRITQNVETALRRELADKLADVPNAPHGLITQLANDEFSVAEPILHRSAALSENDLMKVIQKRSQSHLRAISARKDVTETMSRALVSRGDKEVLVSLAQNKSATIASDTMEQLVEHARSVPELQAPMTGRFDLAPQLLTQMYFFVSSALKREILKRSEMLDPALIDQAIKTNRRKILASASADVRIEFEEAQKYINDKARANAVTESLLKELVETKRATEFLLAFAHYTGIDPATTTRIFQDRSWESLSIASRAVGLERSTFAKIIFGLQRQSDDQAKALRILDLYLKIPQEAAERVMRFWRVRAQSAAASGGASEADQRPRIERKSVKDVLKKNEGEQTFAADVA
ncbi:MAG: DUF2336 domain-containing protein [Pseudomonadota bacterium]